MNRLGFLIRTITGRMDAWRWLVGGALLVAVIRGTDVPSLLQTPLTVVQFACLLGALLTLWFNGRKIYRASVSWLHFVAVAFGLFAALSAVWSPIPLTTLSRSLIFLLLLALVFESARIRWSEAEPAQNDLMLLFWFAVLVSGVGLLFAIFQLDIAWGPYNRLKGLTANADVAAWIAALAFPLGYARLLVASRPRRIWYIAGILILTVTVVATGTRGALVGIGAAILIIHWVRAKSWKVKLAFVGTIFAIAVLLPFGLLPGGRIAESTTDVSSGRLGLWSAGLNLWWHKPVGGWGFGTTSSLPGFAGQNGLSLHNAYLTVLIETGVVGLALFIALIVGLFARRSLGIHPGILAAGAVVLVNGFFESSLVNLGSPVTTQSWVILGAVLALGRTQRPETRALCLR